MSSQKSGTKRNKASSPKEVLNDDVSRDQHLGANLEVLIKIAGLYQCHKIHFQNIISQRRETRKALGGYPMPKQAYFSPLEIIEAFLTKSSCGNVIPKGLKENEYFILKDDELIFRGKGRQHAYVL